MRDRWGKFCAIRMCAFARPPMAFQKCRVRFILFLFSIFIFVWVESLIIYIVSLHYDAHKIVWYTCEWWMINVMANVSMYISYIHFVNKFELPVLVVVCMNIWILLGLFNCNTRTDHKIVYVVCNLMGADGTGDDKNNESAVSIEFNVLRNGLRSFWHFFREFLSNYERRVPT